MNNEIDKLNKRVTDLEKELTKMRKLLSVTMAKLNTVKVQQSFLKDQVNTNRNRGHK